MLVRRAHLGSDPGSRDGGKPPGRSLERRSNAPPRGMIVLDRIRLTGLLADAAPLLHPEGGASYFLRERNIRHGE